MVRSSLDAATMVRYLTVKQSKDHTILKVLHQHVLSYNPKFLISPSPPTAVASVAQKQAAAKISFNDDFRSKPEAS